MPAKKKVGHAGKRREPTREELHKGYYADWQVRQTEDTPPPGGPAKKAPRPKWTPRDYGALKADIEWRKKNAPNWYKSVLENSRMSRPKNTYGYVQDSTGTWRKNEALHNKFKKQGWRGY